MAWDLCSEQDVRDIQTVPTTIPETWSEMVEGMIREHTGLTRLGLTEETYTDYISGDNTTLVRLRKRPVTGITSITIDGVSVDTSNILFGDYYVQLLSGTFTYGVRNVVVTYTAGGGTVTSDIRMAAATMVVAVANFYGRAGSDQSIKWSSMTDGERGGESSPSARLGLADHLNSIMRSMIKNRSIKIA